MCPLSIIILLGYQIHKKTIDGNLSALITFLYKSCQPILGRDTISNPV